MAVGAVNVQPLGAVAPDVGVEYVGVDADWLCSLYAVMAVKPFWPVDPVPEYPENPLYPDAPDAPLAPYIPVGAQVNPVDIGLNGVDVFSLLAV